MAKKSKTRPGPVPLKRSKYLLFASAACLLPGLLIIAVELILRLLGFGGYAPMFRSLGPVPDGNLIMAVQGGAESWFIGNSERAGTSEQYTFVDPKPTNTIRVILVGESAIQGYPEPRHLSASAFLQLMLQDAWPDRRVEVINLGTTAIASFPVLGIMSDALRYDPDLVVIYTGHNEFFGTYGVASVGRAGSRHWMLKVNRWAHSLALVQAIRRISTPKSNSPDRTLMEEMMGQTYIGPDDWRRKAAANNLYENVAEMVRRCGKRGIPALVCTPPTNERGLAPIGLDKLERLSSPAQQEVAALLSKSETERGVEAEADLRKLLQLDPRNARAHYLLGQGLTEQGRHSEALEQYEAARDLDSMPWRAPSMSCEAVERAAREQGATLCDLVKKFRENSPGHAIGWELMDDHVHPTLRGQGLIAEAIVGQLESIEGKLRVGPDIRARLAPWNEYARRLGTNVYDDYAVAHNMRLVFSAQFMRRNNMQAYLRFSDLADGIEKRFSPAVREVLHEWQATRPFEGSRCPVTAAVAQLELKKDNYKEAQGLYQIAEKAVPTYTSWFLEYTYYDLFCRLKLNGILAMSDKQQAHAAIDQGHFLAEHVPSQIDFTKKFTGLLHILCGEYPQAIPYLAAIEPQQTGIDRLMVDQALLVCYAESQQFGKARELLQRAADSTGEYREQYQALLGQLTVLEKRGESKGAPDKGPRLP